MRRIAVVTVGRSDYGIYVPVLRRIHHDPALQLHVLVGGTHLSEAFGSTVRDIEADGFPISARIPMVAASDEPADIADILGNGIREFGALFARFHPDLLVVLGDRFEMYAAVVGALPFHIPIAHLHGGESTEGLMDEAIRHSITKMSHLHFAATERYQQRIVQMGEEPWRVMVSGAPSLDHLQTIRFLTAEEVERQFGLEVREPFLLVTYHPVTLQYEQTERQMQELLTALEEVGLRVVFTAPNADTHGQRIMRMIRDFAGRWTRAQVAVSLGTQGYFSLMQRAAAMVGNSSSGIVEAASFKLPVVNIGDRQRGRLHDENVLDARCERVEIAAAIRQAVSPQFRVGLGGLINSYGDGHAAERIVKRLKDVPLDARLLMKQFHEQPVMV